MLVTAGGATMLSDEIVENAWMRARSRCECERGGHGHDHRCGNGLVWGQRGIPTALGGWEALTHGDPKLGGWMAVNQSEILCWACYMEVIATQNAGVRDTAMQSDGAA